MGPNQVRIIDQMASRLSVRPQESFIKTDTYEGIGQRLIGFCVYVSVVVCHWWRFLFICSKHFESWGLVWLSWPKYGSHYYFFKIAR